MITPDPPGSRTGRWAVWLAGIPGALLLLALTRNSLQHVPLYDELLHFLSARGLLDVGRPVIADGVYERASGCTHLVALAMGRFGETLLAARVPALAGGVMLVFALSCWMARRSGWAGGVLAGLLLSIVPATIQLSVFARFYTIHALVILLIAVVAYEATDRRLAARSRIALLATLPPLLLLAWHLQESTVIAAGAIAAGVVAVILSDHWVKVRDFLRRRPLLSIVGISVLLAAGVAAIFALGLVERLGAAPLWAAGNAARPHYYLQALASELPLLWSLTLAAVVIALHTRRRLAIFFVVVFVSGLIVHSVAASKATRYIYYLMPLLCGTWSCALDGAADRIRAASVAQARRLWLLAACVMAFAVVASQEGQRALKLVAGKVLSVEEMGYAGEADWGPLLGVLRGPVASADRVLTSNSMKALYYLGRYDYEVSASIVRETDSGMEFGIDRRTGRQAISTADSVSRVLETPGTTVVIIEDKKSGAESGVPEAVLAVMENHCGAIGLPAGSAVHAWHCAWP